MFTDPYKFGTEPKLGFPLERPVQSLQSRQTKKESVLFCFTPLDPWDVRRFHSRRKAESLERRLVVSCVFTVSGLHPCRPTDGEGTTPRKSRSNCKQEGTSGLLRSPRVSPSEDKTVSKTRKDSRVTPRGRGVGVPTSNRGRVGPGP